jgi:transposase
MLSLPQPVQIYLALEPADMRRSFDGLAAHVRDWLGQDPLSGHLFVFRSRRGDSVKILFWDRDGLVQYYKRLEEGTFRFPSAKDPQTRCVQVSAEDLSLLLWGIDPRSVRRQKRYQRPKEKISKDSAIQENFSPAS